MAKSLFSVLDEVFLPHLPIENLQEPPPRPHQPALGWAMLAATRAVALARRAASPAPWQSLWPLSSQSGAQEDVFALEIKYSKASKVWGGPGGRGPDCELSCAVPRSH